MNRFRRGELKAMSASIKLGSITDLEIDERDRWRLIDDAVWIYTVAVDLISASSSLVKSSAGLSMSPAYTLMMSLLRINLEVPAGRAVSTTSRNRLPS